MNLGHLDHVFITQIESGGVLMFGVALVGDSAPSSPVGWPFACGTQRRLRISKCRRQSSMAARSRNEMNTLADDMKGHSENGRRWENIVEIYATSTTSHRRPTTTTRCCQQVRVLRRSSHVHVSPTSHPLKSFRTSPKRPRCNSGEAV